MHHRSISHPGTFTFYCMGLRNFNVNVCRSVSIVLGFNIVKLKTKPKLRRKKCNEQQKLMKMKNEKINTNVEPERQKTNGMKMISKVGETFNACRLLDVFARPPMFYVFFSVFLLAFFIGLCAFKKKTNYIFFLHFS